MSTWIIIQTSAVTKISETKCDKLCFLGLSTVLAYAYYHVKIFCFKSSELLLEEAPSQGDTAKETPKTNQRTLTKSHNPTEQIAARKQEQNKAQTSNRGTQKN